MLIQNSIVLIYSSNNSPNEILTVRTERGLFKKSGDESMVFYVIHIFLFESTFPPPQTQAEFGI